MCLSSLFLAFFSVTAPVPRVSPVRAFVSTVPVNVPATARL
jgi:hypothetical protein